MGNPIEVYRSAKIQTEEDYRSPVSSLLKFQRFYNSTSFYSARSQDRDWATISKYWRHNWNRRVDLVTGTAGTKLVITLEDGSTRYFQKVGGTYQGRLENRERLNDIVDGSGAITGYRLQVDDNRVDVFNARGLLVESWLPNGNRVTLLYSGDPGTTAPENTATNNSGKTLPSGLLVRITDQSGRQLGLRYQVPDTNIGQKAMLTQLIDVAGKVTEYKYTDQALTQVIYPDASQRSYSYLPPSNQTTDKELLSGITDENGNTYAKFAYALQASPDGFGMRAISTEHGSGGVDKYSVVSRNVTGTGGGTVAIQDPLGAQRTYTFGTVLGMSKLTRVSQPGGSGCSAASSSLTYDANGNIATRTDFNGNTTTYTYDLTRNLETQRVEASGKPEARTITTQWHPYWRLPIQVAEPKKLTTYIYNDSGLYCAPQTATVPSLAGGTQPIGVLCRKTEQATTDATGSAGFSAEVTGNPRVSRWTYNQYGQVLTANGLRTDLVDSTTYTYHPVTDPDPGKRGRIATIKNPLGHLTQVTAYDLNGRPLSITDPNGVITTLDYWPRGWLRTRSIAGLTTTYDYDAVGQLTQLTRPDGSFIAYEYDDAHRLMAINNARGDSIQYLRDDAGHITQTDWVNPDASAARSQRFVYDALGRLQNLSQTRNGSEATTTTGYDANGNPTFITDAKAQTTTTLWDALDRIKSETDPLNGLTQLAHDGQDQPRQHIAPNGATTGFTIDGLGNLLSETSADRGTRTATYDAAGNLTTLNHGRGVISTTYDALNRPTQITTSNGKVQTLTWDNAPGCTHGIGRLCQISHGNGSDNTVTTYAYDAWGNITTHTRSESGETFTTTLAYDNADRPRDITPPTAETIVVTRDANGQPSQIDATRDSSTFTLASHITYTATARIAAQQLGQTSLTYHYNNAGQLETISRAQAADLHLQYDLNGNVINKITPGKTTAYTYDPLDRIDTETAPAGQRNHAFDANGNRSTDGAGTTATYTPNSNRLASVNGINVTLDAAGNLLNDGKHKYIWDDLGDLVELRKPDNTLIASYYYDAFHHRTRKVTTSAAPQGATTTYYHYQPDGHLLAETTAGNQPKATYVWNGDILTGYITYNPRTAYTVETDHLGSPFQIRTLAGQVVWRWESEAFGRTQPNEDVDGDGKKLEFNVRFPGQYRDQESGLFYNVNRYYDSLSGRYISADPIGLAGGGNLYGYVDGNPLSRIDPTGEDWKDWGVVKGANSTLKKLLTSPATLAGEACGASIDCNFANTPGGEANIVQQCTNWADKLPNPDIRSGSASGAFSQCYSVCKEEIRKRCNQCPPAGSSSK